jgi:hypothetical protein
MWKEFTCGSFHDFNKQLILKTGHLGGHGMPCIAPVNF